MPTHRVDRFAPLALLLILVGIVACHSPSNAVIPDRDVLTAEEIATTDAVTAFDAVRLLRPSFFRVRGEVSLNRPSRNGRDAVLADGDSLYDYPTVFLNSRMLGSIARLRDILVPTVAEIRYLDPSAANLRFGSGYVRGVILVSLKAGSR